MPIQPCIGLVTFILILKQQYCIGVIFMTLNKAERERRHKTEKTVYRPKHSGTIKAAFK